MEVKILDKKGLMLPSYQTSGSAGCDVFADLKKPCILKNAKINITGPDMSGCKSHILIINPSGRALINTGIYASVPEGYEIQVRPRSGLALNKGITVLNTPGCIDSDFRGEIGVILINHGSEPVLILNGDRIAQFILAKVEKIEWKKVEDLDETDRNENGFGSSGV